MGVRCCKIWYRPNTSRPISLIPTVIPTCSRAPYICASWRKITRTCASAFYQQTVGPPILDYVVEKKSAICLYKSNRRHLVKVKSVRDDSVCPLPLDLLISITINSRGQTWCLFQMAKTTFWWLSTLFSRPRRKDKKEKGVHLRCSQG